MSEPDDQSTGAPGAGGTGASRRRFLAGAGAGLAVTAVGVGVASASAEADTSGAAGAAEAQTTTASRVRAGAPLVVYVPDVNRDSLSIQEGNTEVVVRNRALVQALDRAARRRRAAGKGA